MNSTFSFGAPAPAAGQPSQPTFTLTGATPNPTPPAASGAPSLFNFGNTSTSAPASQQQQGQAGSSMFGAQATTSQPASTGFSFGAPKPAQSSAPASNMFSSTPSTQGGTSLFGGPQPAQAAAPTGTGLFGSTAPAQPAAGSSLFGAPQQQPQAGQTLFGQNSQQPGTSSLFGSSAQQATSTGMFGQQQQQQQQQQQAGSSMFGAQQGNSLQASGSGGSGQSGLSKTTKFSELPEQHQKNVEDLDGWIKQQKAAAQGISSDSLGKAIWRTTTEIKAATEARLESSALTQSLQNTAQALTSLQQRFVTEEEDVRRLAEIWDTYKSVEGRPGALRVAGHKEWPAEFFGRIARSLEERVGRYKATIAQLHRVVASLTSESETASPQTVSQTIHNHQNAMITLAAQLESLQIRMNGLKYVFAQEYRDRTNSMRDPFEVAREEKGLPPVRV